jgi:RNA 3'-phosphate cyclase
MIRIEGSLGEGGGQILRTALSLSLLTGKEFSIENIRASRPKPGLRPQHIKAVEAAAEVSRASVTGAVLGSSAIVFKPGEVRPGRYQFDIGTAGSTSLVLQTIFVPLSRTRVASSVTITGGTHVPWSPSYEYLTQIWLPYLEEIGFDGQVQLDRAGFYPQGGGRIQATIRPSAEVESLDLIERGNLHQIRGMSAIANLDRRIAERQRSQVVRRLGDRYYLNDIRISNLPATHRGTVIFLVAEFENSQAGFFALGELGKPAERVADEAIDALVPFLESEGCIDRHLADQLLLPLAFASGISRLKTEQVTNHLLTNAKVIMEFLPARIDISAPVGSPGLVTIEPVDLEG